MKGKLVGLFIIITIMFALAISTVYAQQSTTGPIPPRDLDPGWDYSSRAQVVIPGVPTYIWHHGCGPTALGMAVGYWDGIGFNMLVDGDASTQTSAVENMIAQDSGNENCSSPISDHFHDYSCPKDYYPNLLTDKSELGGAHTSNCVADFMETSWSQRGNYYGWSWFSDIRWAFFDYVDYIAPHYNPTSTNNYFGVGSWDIYCAEIDANRPVVLLVDTNGDGYTDHFVTGVGYDDTNVRYACYNTWDHSIHWFDWRGLSSSYTWGIYGFTMFNLVLPELNLDVSKSSDDVFLSWNPQEYCSLYYSNTLPLSPIQLAENELSPFEHSNILYNGLTYYYFIESTGSE